MNKQDLVSSIATKSELTKVDAEKALNAFVEAVQEGLAEDGKVQLVGFGTFEVREQKGREGIINMGAKKGQKWKSEDCKIPAFKAGKALKDLIKNS